LEKSCTSFKLALGRIAYLVKLEITINFCAGLSHPRCIV
jgi:hypothetical protein